MPFRYSCFISYRYASPQLPAQQQHITRFIEEFTAALSVELRPLIEEKPIYVAHDRLHVETSPGNMLPTALCESMCMIMLYTPAYFDYDALSCAREYKAMEQLEKRRLGLLPAQPYKNLGLILPVVLRGKSTLPVEIKEHRQIYDFTDLLPVNSKLALHPRSAVLVKRIAEHLTTLAQAFAQVNDNICKDCKNFRLPSERKVQQWLKSLQSTTLLFPGHEGSV